MFLFLRIIYQSLVFYMLSTLFLSTCYTSIMHIANDSCQRNLKTFIAAHKRNIFEVQSADMSWLMSVQLNGYKVSSITILLYTYQKQYQQHINKLKKKILCKYSKIFQTAIGNTEDFRDRVRWGCRERERCLQRKCIFFYSAVKST